MKNLIKKKYYEFSYLIFLGIFSAFSLPPYNYYIINFITFTLFFIFILRERETRKNNLFLFKCGWFFGFGYFLSSLYWIFIPLTFDEKFKFLIPMAIIIIPSFLAIFYGLVTYFFSIFYSQKVTISFLIFSILFGIIEMLRSFVLTGFPWNLISFSFSENLYIIQIISIIGTYSFNLICISIFASPALLVLKKSQQEIILFIFFILTFISIIVFGNLKNNYFDSLLKIENNYKIRIVSPNIALDRFYSVNNEAKIINELIFLSQPDSKENTIFIWPEGVITDTYLNNIKKYENLFVNNFSENHIIILGVNSLKIKNKDNLYFNSLGVFDNRLNLIDSYDKIKLVPFGEFLPFEKTLNKLGLQVITNNYGSFAKGKIRKSIDIKSNDFKFKILPLICYEIIYSGKLFKAQKFDYIINISEDGWFGKSIGRDQHFAHSIFRSIESGKYVLRSANNGISAIINPLGKVEKSIKLETRGYIDFIEAKTVKETIFSKYGNKIFIFLILLYIFLIFSFNKIKNE